MDVQIEEILSSLHSRHINGFFTENSEEANRKILSLIPKDAVVGIGDSTTMRQMGIPKALKGRGTKVLDAFELKGPQVNPVRNSSSVRVDTDGALNPAGIILKCNPAAEQRDIISNGANPKDAQQSLKGVLKEATISDVFLTGTNAIIRDGRLVNVDAVGNRVAGMFWGHPTSIIAVGRNKIVKDLDEAFYRIRNIIAPNHVRIRSVELGGRNPKTPCAATGECNDCRATDRICNIFSIIEGKPFFTDLNVVIVNEDLGLGWDPSWPQARIMQILENYKKFVWLPP